MFKIRSRILAMILLATTIITSVPLSSAPIHAHADSDSKVNDKAENTGSGDGGLNSSLSGNLSWYSNRQGYRIYIINSNFERISPVYDFYNIDPFDDEVEIYNYTTRFDSAISPDESTASLHKLDDLKEWCSATSYPPLAVLNLGGGNYKGNGAAFKDWFFAGKEGTIHTGSYGGGNQITKATPTPKPQPTSIPKQPKCAKCKDLGHVTDGNGKYSKCPDCTITQCPQCGNKLNMSGVCTKCEIAWYSFKCGYCGSTLNADRTCSPCEALKCTTCGRYKTGSYCPACDYTTCGYCGRRILKRGACDSCQAANQYNLCIKCTRVLDNNGNCSTCNPSTNDYIARVPYPDSHWAPTNVLAKSTQEMVSLAQEVYNDKKTAPNLFNKDLLETHILNYQKFIESNFSIINSVYDNIHPDDAVDYAVGVTCADLKAVDLSMLGSITSALPHENMLDLKSVLEHRNYILSEAAKRFKQTDVYKDSFYATGDSSKYSELTWDDVYASSNKSPDTPRVASADSLLFNPIPLAGGDTEKVYTTNGESPAYNLVNQTEHIKVNGYEYPSQALADGGFLVVEPITWLNKRTGTGAWDDPSQYTPYPVYGTYWNLVQGWVGGAGFYSTNLKELFNHCLITSKDVTSTGSDGNVHVIKAVTDTSAKEVSKSVQLMNDDYGLSMHIYDADSKTSTYDESLPTPTPAPAPDDSNKLSEDEKNDPEKHATIIKFYEDTSTEEIKRQSFVRTPAPKSIQFEDESSETGYIIEEWFTTDTHIESVASDAIYSDYKDSNDILRDSEKWVTFNPDTGEGNIITLGDESAGEDAKEKERISKERTLLILYRNGTSTSTYDEPKLTTPAPAPDDTDLLTNDQLQDHAQHAVIVKYYEETVTTNGTTTLTNHGPYTRTHTPSIIEIEDEPEYKVESWFTTSNPTHTSPNPSTYETYADAQSATTPVNTGSSTTKIELDLTDPSAPENVLYVLLTKETTSTTTVVQSEGDWTLTESQLTILTTADKHPTEKLSTHKFKLSLGSLAQTHTD